MMWYCKPSAAGISHENFATVTIGHGTIESTEVGILHLLRFWVISDISGESRYLVTQTTQLGVAHSPSMGGKYFNPKAGLLGQLWVQIANCNLRRTLQQIQLLKRFWKTIILGWAPRDYSMTYVQVWMRFRGFLTHWTERRRGKLQHMNRPIRKQSPLFMKG